MIARMDKALAEIRAVAGRDAALAAEGAVVFVEKVFPAVRDAESSWGALGSAAYGAVEALVPIIAAAPVSDAVRTKWLDRLWEAIEVYDPRYLWPLGDHWGDLCVTPEFASRWADCHLPMLKDMADERRRGLGPYFTGASLCYSALFKAGRHNEILGLLEADPSPVWLYLIWGGRVLAARQQVDDAIAYLETRLDERAPMGTLARFAEEVLLRAGRRAEAYTKYAVAANQANSRLATYRAIAKKYPEIEPDRLLRDLIDATPGEEGKWFATAKTLKRLDLAPSSRGARRAIRRP